MTVLAPVGLAALIAAPIVILLWLLHSRFRSAQVPSLLLWLDVHVALVLDGSVSMQATDVAPSRFQVARERLLGVLTSANPADHFNLVLATRRPYVVLRSQSAGAIRAALDQTQADGEASDLASAVRVAAKPGVSTACILDVGDS